MWMMDLETSEAINEIDSGGSDRSVGIVSAAVLEFHLEATLRAALRDDKEIVTNLFRPSGPLGSFSAKIDLGLLLGVYGRKLHRDLRLIKDIRNTFAHNLKINSFENQKIKDIVRNLGANRRHKFTVEAVYKKDKSVIPKQKFFAPPLESDPNFTKQHFLQNIKICVAILSAFIKMKRPKRPEYG